MRLNKPARKLIEPLTSKWERQDEFLADVGAGMVELVKQRITSTKSDADGKKWAPWASSTAKARRRAGTEATGLLLITGALRDSLYYEVTGPKVSVKTSNRYAGWLQNGTSKMPARPFLGTGPGEEKLINDLWKKWMGE